MYTILLKVDNNLYFNVHYVCSDTFGLFSTLSRMVRPLQIVPIITLLLRLHLLITAISQPPRSWPPHQRSRRVHLTL